MDMIISYINGDFFDQDYDLPRLSKKTYRRVKSILKRSKDSERVNVRLTYSRGEIIEDCDYIRLDNDNSFDVYCDYNE